MKFKVNIDADYFPPKGEILEVEKITREEVFFTNKDCIEVKELAALITCGFIEKHYE